MELVKRDAVASQALPGRAVQKVVGKDAQIASGKMTMGFATYADHYGPMEPHRHAEETVYVVAAAAAWVKVGAGKEVLGEAAPLAAGMTMHFDELEWHQFGFAPGGHLDVIFFYGQVDNIRPEEIAR
ncbi:MAG: cupin domain-containing protein [Chloroflexota bacterium]